MTSNFDPIFLRLRSILSKHAGTFSVREAGPVIIPLRPPPVLLLSRRGTANSSGR